MRKTLLLSTFVTLSLLTVLALPLAADAEEQTWVGWITDANCGAKGATAEHAACARKCHADGAALVLYTPEDEALHPLSDQEMAAEHLGHEVAVTGELADGTIQVVSIEPHGEMEDSEDGDMDHGDGHGHGDHGGHGR